MSTKAPVQKVAPPPPLFEGDRRINQTQAMAVRDRWPAHDKRSPIRVDRRLHRGRTRILFTPPRRMMQLAWKALRNGVQDLADLLFAVR